MQSDPYGGCSSPKGVKGDPYGGCLRRDPYERCSSPKGVPSDPYEGIARTTVSSSGALTVIVERLRETAHDVVCCRGRHYGVRERLKTEFFCGGLANPRHVHLLPKPLHSPSPRPKVDERCCVEARARNGRPKGRRPRCVLRVFADACGQGDLPGENPDGRGGVRETEKQIVISETEFESCANT